MESDRTLGYRERVVGVTILFLVFAAGIFDHSLWSSNDSREGAMIWDMYSSGNWTVPTLNGEAYLEKPPLLHWTGATICLLSGRVSEGLVRLPAAIYGLAAVLVAWVWAARTGRDRAGLAAAFMCATSLLYMEYSKIVLTDAALTFCVIASLYLFWKAWSATSGRLARFAIFIVASALTFYAKGLIGPGFVWTSVMLFLVYRREWRLAVVLPLVFLPVFALVLAPWVVALWKAGGMEYIRSVFWDNQVGRFLSFSDRSLPADPFFVHKEPLWYYIKNLPPMLLPWLPLIPPAIFHWFRRQTPLRNPSETLISCAVVAMTVVLHVSTAKVACYALPLFPFLFIITAAWLEDLGEAPAISKGWIYLVWFSFLLAAILPLVLSIAYTVLYFAPTAFLVKNFGMDVLRAPGHGIAAGCLFAATGALVLTVYVVARFAASLRKGNAHTAFLRFPVGVAPAMMLAAMAAIPAYDFQRSYRPFASVVASEMHAGRKVILGTDGTDYVGALTFYLNTRMVVTTNSMEIRRFLVETPGPSGVVVETEQVKQLRPLLDGLDISVLRATRCGFKSDYFRLLTHGDTPVMRRHETQ